MPDKSCSLHDQLLNINRKNGTYVFILFQLWYQYINYYLVINKCSNIIATGTKTIYFLVFGQTFANRPKCTADYWSVSNSFKFRSGSRILRKRGRQPWGRQHMILPNFPKNCMKLRKCWVPLGPLRSATEFGYSIIGQMLKNKPY